MLYQSASGHSEIKQQQRAAAHNLETSFHFYDNESKFLKYTVYKSSYKKK